MRGHVRKRGSRWSYVVDVGRDESGKRRQKWVGGFRTKKDAQGALNETINRLAQGTYIEPTRQTVAGFIREWLPAIRTSIRPATWESYKANLEIHVVPRIGTHLLWQLTAPQLNHLYAELLDKGRNNGRGGLSARTVRYVHHHHPPSAIRCRSLGEADPQPSRTG